MKLSKMSGKEENLKFFYEMCIKEHEKASINLDAYKLQVTNILRCVKHNRNIDHDRFIEQYDRAITNLSLVSDVLRKFNIQVELTHLKPVDINYQPISTEIVDLPTKVFTYPLNEPFKYTESYESDCIITYVKDAAKRLFYIMDIRSSTYTCNLLNMGTYFEKSPFPLSVIPKEGVVFGLYMDNYMFRVVRENERKDDDDVFKVYLIDVGETIEISAGSTSIYTLSEAYQKIPALALLCKLEKVFDGVDNDPESFLRKNQYGKQKFKITKVISMTLHVELIPEGKISTNPFSKEMNIANLSSNDPENPGLGYPLSNPFLQFRCKTTESNTNVPNSQIWNNHENIKNVANSRQHNENTLMSSQNKSENILPDNNKISNNNNLTSVQYNNCKVNMHQTALNPFAKEFDNKTQTFYNDPKNFELPKLSLQNNLNNSNLTLCNNYDDSRSSDTEVFTGYNNFISDHQIHNTSIVKNNIVNADNCDAILREFVPEIYSMYNGLKLNEADAISPNNIVLNSKFVNQPLTPEQQKILFEEPLNTENAMTAVMGYNPQDDKRICKFFNPNTNSCFKGANCKMEHMSKITDGWTRDKKPTKLLNRCGIAYPSIGSNVTLIPTHINNVESFYAQIPSQNSSNLPELKEMVLKMNSNEIKSKYVQLTKPPVELELVLALFKDDLWYRAKVVMIIDNETIKVFYVDYGNCSIVSLSCISNWDERFDYYPFQAIHCKLDNVNKIKEHHSEAIDKFKKMVLNRPLTATVINYIDQLSITLMDDEGFDIGEYLCAINLATFKPVSKLVLNNDFLPG